MKRISRNKNPRDTTVVTAILVAIIVTLLGCTDIEVLSLPTSTVSISNGQVTINPTTQKPREIATGSIRGRVMSKSDVSTQPDSSLRALVMAISSDKFVSFLEEAGFDGEKAANFGKLGFTLSEELFEKYIETSVISQNNGEYKLDLPPGKYLLCVANSDLAARSEILSVYVDGCIEVVVLEGKQEVKDIFLQFGWVTSQ